jgi:putative sterol carrier protein
VSSNVNVEIATDGFEQMRNLIAQRRQKPGDDILSALVHLEDGGDRLSTDELLPLVAALILGAWDTTGQALAFALLTFLRHPDQAQILREHPELIAGAVEETLRFDYFARLGAFRYAEEDLQIHGVKISTGQCVIACIASAHRDPDVFSNPDVFDITRPPGALLSFGGGAHICIGMALARFVMQEAIGAFVRCFPHARLKEQPIFSPHPLVRVLCSLPVSLSSKPATVASSSTQLQSQALPPPSGDDDSAVKATFDALMSRFKADKAAGTNAVIQYNIRGNGGGTWHVVIDRGSCTVNTGPAASPQLILEISAHDWLDMSAGKKSGPVLFISGKLKLKGDMALAGKLGSMFES